MKKVFQPLFLLFILTAFVFSAFAQDGNDTVGTFEVRLPVTVKDKKNNLVAGLTKSDFVVYEDGVPQDLTFFTDEKSNPPIYVGVLMDTSVSTKGKLDFAKDSAKNLIYTITQIRKDKAAFMTFDHDVLLRQDFTDKLDLLAAAVDGVDKAGSQTALYDALWTFTDEKLTNAAGRRVIVIISDGDDTFSRANIDDVIDIAQRTETTIFGISTKEGFAGTVPGVDLGTVKDKGDKYLMRLCEETGGEAFFENNVTDLERSFTKISKELHNQYIITYRPQNQNYDGKKRKIEVRFRDKNMEKKYKIRTKDSYRAVKDTLK